MIKSFIKWAGGKKYLLPKFDTILKEKDFSQASFFELFGGSGVLSLNSTDKFKKVYLNDINKEIINAFLVVKNHKSSLLNLLEVYKKNHCKKFYYEIRSEKFSYSSVKDKIESAARTIYLNKAGFNGLYRVNSVGDFNVPFGKKTSVNLFNYKEISTASEILKKVNLSSKDYKSFLRIIKKGDFVYIDPPYFKVKKDSFVGYNKIVFSENDQLNLKNFIDKLTKKGTYVVFSNSLTEFTKKLFKDYLDENSAIKVKYYIGSTGNSRKDTEEIFCNNFKYL
jgi:DNA adenine methylase